MEKRIAIITILLLIGSVVVMIFVPEPCTDDLSTIKVTNTEVYAKTEKNSEMETETTQKTEELDMTDTYFMGEKLHYSKPYKVVEHPLSVKTGLVYFRGHVEVWYSVKEKIGYTTEYDIPGKHVADDGTIRDKDGYICVASKDLPKGHTLLTSLGPGKVYDRWETSRSIGIYTDWR